MTNEPNTNKVDENEYENAQVHPWILGFFSLGVLVTWLFGWSTISGLTCFIFDSCHNGMGGQIHFN